MAYIKILAVDYGDVRTGLAISDALGMMANGIGTVKEIKSAGADYEVSVSFTGKGIKKFMAGLSKLKKVETE